MAQGSTIPNSVQLPLSVQEGGTGKTSWTSGRLIYSPSANTLDSLPTANSGVVVTDAAGAVVTLAGPGVSNYPLMSTASAAPAWSTVPYANALGWTTFTATVTLVGGAGNTTPTFTTSTGRYSQLGNVINMSVYLNNTSGGTAGAGTGQINIALPIAAGASVANGTVMVVGNYLNNTTNGILLGTINASGTTVSLSYFSALTTLSNLTGADLNHANTRQISFTLIYEV